MTNDEPGKDIHKGGMLRGSILCGGMITVATIGCRSWNKAQLNGCVPFGGLERKTILIAVPQVADPVPNVRRNPLNVVRTPT